MAKKPKIEVDESLVKQVIAGQLPITTKVTRVIPEQIPSGTATDAIPAEPPSVPEIDTEKIPDETPSVPAAQEPRRRRTPPLSDYERMFLTPVEYGIRATLYVNASTKRKILEILKRIVLGKRLVIALILTIPTFVITLLALAKIAMPGWLTNPWPHAIVITPVMFYCAAPIHHRGLPALQRRHPNGDSLVSLGMAIVYAYSLLLCVVSWIFPAGSRDPYFAFVGVVATLSLAGTLVRQHAMTAQQTAETEKAQSAQSTESTESARSQAKSPEPTQEKSAEELLFRAVVGHAIRARVLQITTSVTMVVAVWTCALWLAFGVQPKPAIAILLGSTVLSVAGLVLQAYDRQVTNR